VTNISPPHCGRRPKTSKGRNRGEGHVLGGARELGYGDLAVEGQRLRSARRWSEWWRLALPVIVRRLSGLRAGVWRKMVWRTQHWSAPCCGRLRSERTGERLFGVVAVRLS
jgi:hypothetical protein